MGVGFKLCSHLSFPSVLWDGNSKAQALALHGISFGADAFTVDGIAALHREGYSLRKIADSGVVEIPDGDPVSFGMIGKVVWRVEAEPGCRRKRAEGSGRPRETAEAEEKALVRTFKRRRGQEKTT